MKLLLADDHGLFRDSVALWLQKIDSEIEIIFAIDYSTTIQAIKNHSIDVIILDLYMPKMEGVISVEYICKEFNIPTIIVSAEDNPSIIQRCIKLGVKGYVPKSVKGNVILQAVKNVIQGDTYFPDTPPNYNTEIRSESPEFSTKQLQVLSLIVEGKTNKEIGETLFLSEGTVKQYVTKLLRELDVDNRVQASNKGAEILALKKVIRS